MVHDVGFLSYGFLYDARMLVLTNELIRRAKHLTAAVDVDHEQESIQALNEVARGTFGYGSFLDHPSTAKEFRENLWLPPRFIQRKLLDLDPLDTHPQRELNEGLTQQVTAILASHQVKSMTEEKLSEIDRCLDSPNGF
jgi:trimethylamine:corrinoid methyltransferase-like protein